MLSLRDKIHSTAEALLQSALMSKEACSSFAASCGFASVNLGGDHQVPGVEDLIKLALMGLKS
jgi:hypothetical protein